MKKILLTLMLAISALSMVVADADARRLGGGRSFGRQSQNVTQKAAPAAPSPSQASNQARPAAPAAAPAAIPPKPSPWKGILGGALLGLGVGALLSHFGLGGALGSMLGTLLMAGLLAFAVMFVIRMLRRKDSNHLPGMTPSYPGAASSSAYTPEIGSRIAPTSQQPAALQAEPAVTGTASAASWNLPADFDVPGFLRHAKTHFIRLQAAWDKADIDDIREFTTPEMYAELKLDLQERGTADNNTDVVSINAELLGIETVGGNYMASVKFDGMIKEDDKSAAAPFAEVWNLTKPLAGQGGWVLAGIQQLS